MKILDLLPTSDYVAIFMLIKFVKRSLQCSRFVGGTFQFKNMYFKNMHYHLKIYSVVDLSNVKVTNTIASLVIYTILSSSHQTFLEGNTNQMISLTGRSTSSFKGGCLAERMEIPLSHKVKDGRKSFSDVRL